jgi:hypothetical protein
VERDAGLFAEHPQAPEAAATQTANVISSGQSVSTGSIFGGILMTAAFKQFSATELRRNCE